MTVPHRTHPVRDRSLEILVTVSAPSVPPIRHSSDQLAARAIRLVVTGEGSIEHNAATLAELAEHDVLRLRRAKWRIGRAGADRSSTVVAHALAALDGAIRLASGSGATSPAPPARATPTGSARRRWPTGQW